MDTTPSTAEPLVEQVFGAGGFIGPEREVILGHQHPCHDRPQFCACVKRCDSAYRKRPHDRNEAEAGLQWDRCYANCQNKRHPGTGSELAEHARHHRTERARKRNEVAWLNSWERFGLLLGGVMSYRFAAYDGAFALRNGRSVPTATAADRGVIKRPWRSGMDVSVSTGPGFTRWPFGNALFRATLFSATVYECAAFFRHSMLRFSGIVCCVFSVLPIAQTR